MFPKDYSPLGVFSAFRKLCHSSIRVFVKRKEARERITSELQKFGCNTEANGMSNQGERPESLTNGHTSEHRAGHHMAAVKKDEAFALYLLKSA
jgi:hypothetical protein